MKNISLFLILLCGYPSFVFSDQNQIQKVKCHRLMERLHRLLKETVIPPMDSEIVKAVLNNPDLPTVATILNAHKNFPNPILIGHAEIIDAAGVKKGDHVIEIGPGYLTTFAEAASIAGATVVIVEPSRNDADKFKHEFLTYGANGSIFPNLTLPNIITDNFSNVLPKLDQQSYQLASLPASLLLYNPHIHYFESQQIIVDTLGLLKDGGYLYFSQYATNLVSTNEIIDTAISSGYSLEEVPLSQGFRSDRSFFNIEHLYRIKRSHRKIK